MLLSAKAKFVSKRVVGVIANLIHMSKNNSHKHTRAIAISKDEYFNCYWMGHFGQNYRFPDYCNKKKNSNSSSNNRQKRENKLPRLWPWQINIMTNLVNDKNSRPEPFRLGKVFITTKSSTLSQTQSTWYQDLCTSRHLTNNQGVFASNIQPKMWDFTTAGVQIIRSKDVEMVRIALADKTSIEFEGIALVLECKSNFISLGQLQDNKIYHD